MTSITTQQAPTKRKAAVWIAIGLGVLFLVAANGHLVYVAVRSQPACVDHVRQGDLDSAKNRFHAAKSSCSPR